MRILLLLFSFVLLVRCANDKEMAQNEKVIKLNNQIDSMSVVDTTSIVYLDTTVELVEELKFVRNDDIRFIDDKKQIKLIKSHETKTQLKVFDKSTNSIDTTTGWIAYSVPEDMKVSKSYSVKVRISKRHKGQNKAVLILGDEDAINNPNYESVATIDDIKVSGEMSAELRGDVEAFNIVALSTLVQNIDKETYTEWEWVVTPKKSGQNPLKLVVKVKDINKDIVVFNRTINVKKNVPVAFEGFLEKYWQWLMTTIIIPIFIYFWNRKKRKTKKS